MSEQLDFALNLVNEFSGPAEEGAKSAVALASAIMQSEKAAASLQKALDKEDRIGALAAKIAKANAELKIAALTAPKVEAAAPIKALSPQASGALGMLGGKDTSAATLSYARAVLSVESAQRALNKAQADGDPLKVLQATVGLKSAQEALRVATGETGKTFGGLGTVIGEVAAGPLGTYVKMVTAATAATAGLLAAGFAFVLSQADQKRSMQLTLQAMLGSEEAGIAMEEQFQSMAKSLPITRDALDEMGKSLITAGLRGAELTNTLETLATVESTMGAEGANKLKNMIEKWNIVGHFEEPPAKALLGTGVTLDMLQKTLAEKTGKSVEQVKALIKAGKITTEQGIDALNAAINSKLGNVAAQKLLGVGVQFQKFKENVGNLFEDALGDNFEKFLQSLQSLLSLFDSDTESGKTLKFLIDQLFSAMGDGATGVMPLLKATIEGIEIAFLEMYVALKPVVRGIQEFMGQTPDSSLEDSFVAIGEAIGYTMGAVGGLIALLAAAPLALVSFVQSIAEPFVALYDIMVKARDDLINFWLDAGSAIVDGLIAGVTGNFSKVGDAMSNLGTAALGSLKSVLGIASPSKEFAILGGHVAAGMAEGVDAGAPAVNDSVSAMVAPPAVQSAGARGPVSVQLNFEIGAGAKAEDAQAIADAVVAKLTNALESVGLQMGEGAPLAA